MNRTVVRPDERTFTKLCCARHGTARVTLLGWVINRAIVGRDNLECFTFVAFFLHDSRSAWAHSFADSWERLDTLRR